jgi:hypothetical protein
MMPRVMQASFEREADFVQAAERVNGHGWRIVDVFTPYPLHDTPRLLGLRRSRLPYFAFLCGVSGVGLAFWFQFWVSAWDWPINVGGRPWNSLPAFVPVAFETMVLFAGIGIVLAWIVRSRLYPGRVSETSAARVTDDCFVIEVEEPSGDAEGETLRRLLRECHARHVDERRAP